MEKKMAKQIILNNDSPSIVHLCKHDKRLSKVISMVGPISYEIHDEDPYAFLVHEIIEQMLSIKAGAKIYNRLSDLCNGHISPESISRLSDDEIRSTGTSNSKVQYIKGLTSSVLYGDIVLGELEQLSDSEVCKRLTSLKGIGYWTAKMYLIFVLNRQDILPYEDVAFLQSYMWMYKTSNCNRKSIETKCKKWKPYSSIAARYLYRDLDMGLTKEDFHLYK